MARHSRTTHHPGAWIRRWPGRWPPAATAPYVAPGSQAHDAPRFVLTKEDIIRLEVGLAEIELRLTRRMYALAIAQAGATVALTVTLLRVLA